MLGPDEELWVAVVLCCELCRLLAGAVAGRGGGNILLVLPGTSWTQSGGRPSGDRTGPGGAVGLHSGGGEIRQTRKQEEDFSFFEII